MNQAPLLLVVDDQACFDAVNARADAVLALIEPTDRPGLQVITASAVLADVSLLRRVAAVWIMVDSPARGWRWEVINAVAESQTPAMLTRPGLAKDHIGKAEDGVVLCADTAALGLLSSVLQTLLVQSPVVRAMRAEIKLMRAHQGGLADQIGRIDEELRLAAQLQREFLPTEMPGMNGVGFEVLWQPAGYVSGDIYDVIRLDEAHIGFFLADAVGHGVPAALMTVFIKQCLTFKRIDKTEPRGYRIVGPGEALAQLNRDMVTQQNGHVRFATACCGVINCKTRRVTLARAGHPYPMLLRADGSHEMIEADGGLLGVFEEEQFEQVTVDLGEGDRFLIYSDGFEMAFPNPDPKACVANNQYTREFMDMIHGSGAEALDRLRHKLDQQAGSLNQRDDLTVVCLAVDAEAAALPTGACVEAAA